MKITIIGLIKQNGLDLSSPGLWLGDGNFISTEAEIQEKISQSEKQEYIIGNGLFLIMDLG